MQKELEPGACVRLLSLPNWLLHDLPDDEKEEMAGFVGKCATVEKVEHGKYIWIGFGSMAMVGEDMRYSGHSFCVTEENVELIIE